MGLISDDGNTYTRNLNFKLQKQIPIFSIFIVLNSLLNASAEPVSNGNDLIDDHSDTQLHAQTKVESDFLQSFYSHTRPYHYDNDLSAKIRNLLSISTGGINKTKFIGLGFREKSIEWDGLAIETTYKKILETYGSSSQTSGSDITSIFSTSLLSE
tara:strand:- start:159 stop:626 length:468 start_codon:yes stop_codon:yes gene_type:complete